MGRPDELAQRLRQRPNGNSRLRLARLFGRGNGAPDAEAPRGLYIYGPVGRGKTMLMDLFFDSVEHSAKRRAHFNVFMADVHDRIRIVRARIKTRDIRNGA